MTRTARLDGGVGVDLIFRLGDANAPRRCAACGDDARYYVLDDDADVSRYACPQHLDGTVREAGGDPGDVGLNDDHPRAGGNGRPRRNGGGSE